MKQIPNHIRVRSLVYATLSNGLSSICRVSVVCDIIRVPGDERQGASSCDVSMTSAVVSYSHEESTTLGTVRERTDNETTRHEVEIDKCEAHKELNSPPLTNEVSDLSADQIQNYRSESETINGRRKMQTT